MVSNKVKRNIWLVLTVMSALSVLNRAIRVFDGSAEWWQLVSAVVITAVSIRFYTTYRRQVKRGNLFGRVKVF